MPNRSLLPLLMLMVVFSPLAIDIFLPALPVMAQEFSVPLTQIQWSIAVFLFTMGTGQLFSGPLADRYGRKPIAIAGIVIYTLASILSALSTSLELFLICRMAQGFGACAIAVTAFACVRDRYDQTQSGAVYSYLNGAIFCVPALAPILGSVLTEQFGWRSNFEFLAVYAIVAGAFVVFGLPETRPETTTQHKKLITLKRYTPIITHPVFMFNSLVAMLTLAVILAYVSTSPAWLIVHLGLDQQAFVFWFSLNATLNIVACLFAPKVLVKLGARKTIGFGMSILLVSGLLLLSLLDWDNVLALMIPVMFSSIGGALLMGSCAGQALSPFGNNAGTASALFNFIQLSGAAVLVFLVQLLPLNAPEQLVLIILSFLPVFVLWKLPIVKEALYQTNAAAG